RTEPYDVRARFGDGPGAHYRRGPVARAGHREQQSRRSRQQLSVGLFALEPPAFVLVFDLLRRSVRVRLRFAVWLQLGNDTSAVRAAADCDHRRTARLTYSRSRSRPGARRAATRGRYPLSAAPRPRPRRTARER